jgi:hypothetical protein
VSWEGSCVPCHLSKALEIFLEELKSGIGYQEMLGVILGYMVSGKDAEVGYINHVDGGVARRPHGLESAVK